MDSFDISASGLSAQRARLDILASNIANVETTRTPAGGPYRRLLPVFASRAKNPGGVEMIGIAVDPRDPRRVYQPGHPDADADGFVAYPNVNIVEEMVDLVSATRSYQANAAAYNAAKSMAQRALDLGRA
ncbi:MAG: flagellar basal body rod protein FlgC [Armatimonadota bacterium]|nr:MAG: flagellar basal body rod protein FlgC [Armatimonadota bacterium]